MKLRPNNHYLHNLMALFKNLHLTYPYNNKQIVNNKPIANNIKIFIQQTTFVF